MIRAASLTRTVKPYIWIVWALLSVLLFGCYPLSPFVDYIPIGDETIYITIAKWMNEGMVMYRDMFDHKGLAIYWFNMLGLRCGGLTGIWILTCIWVFVSTWLAYVICRMFAGERASFIASFFFILITTRTSSNDTPEMVAMPFVVAGYYVLLRSWYANRIPSFIESAIATFAFGIICLLKPNIGAGLVALILIHIVRMYKGGNVLNILKCLTGGVLGFCIPVGYALYYIISNEAWNDYVSTFWLFNMEYSATYTLSQRIASVIKLGILSPTTAMMWMFFVFAVPVMIKEGEWSKLWPILIVHLFLFVLNLNLSGWPLPYYLLPLFPMYVIYVARFFEWAQGWKTVYGLSIVGVCACYIGYRSVLEYMGCDSGWIVDKYSKEIAQHIEKWTDKEDKVMIYKYSVAPYIYTERHSPSKYLYQSPIFDIRPSAKEEFMNDIRNDRPKMIIVQDCSLSEIPKDIMNNYTSKPSPIEGIQFFTLNND